MINGVTDLIMTKPDVLSGFEKIYACTHYQYEGKKIDFMPYDIVHNDAKPVFEESKGWKEPLTGITAESQFPKELNEYVKYLEEHLQVPISIVSVGPDRNQTIIRKGF